MIILREERDETMELKDFIDNVLAWDVEFNIEEDKGEKSFYTILDDPDKFSVYISRLDKNKSLKEDLDYDDYTGIEIFKRYVYENSIEVLLYGNFDEDEYTINVSKNEEGNKEELEDGNKQE